MQQIVLFRSKKNDRSKKELVELWRQVLSNLWDLLNIRELHRQIFCNCYFVNRLTSSDLPRIEAAVFSETNHLIDLKKALSFLISRINAVFNPFALLNDATVQQQGVDIEELRILKNEINGFLKNYAFLFQGDENANKFYVDNCDILERIEVFLGTVEKKQQLKEAGQQTIEELPETNSGN